MQGSAPTALLVAIDDARFLPDGRANVTGRGIERVPLRRCWVEEGTGGLWYASVDSTVERGRDSSQCVVTVDCQRSRTSRQHGDVSAKSDQKIGSLRVADVRVPAGVSA